MSPNKTKDMDSRKGRRARSSFAVLLKIVVIGPKGEYCRTVWCAIGIGISQLLIGATVMAILMYSLRTGDVHAILCYIAYHFFSAEAILSLNYANGWSTPLWLRHRRRVHACLQICGVIFAISGTVLVITNKGLSASAHGLTGVVTVCLAILSALSGLGPCIFGKKCFKIIHMSCGLPAFMLSSVSICFGLFTPSFKSWTDSAAICILTGFVVFYSVFIITATFIKCMVLFI